MRRNLTPFFKCIMAVILLLLAVKSQAAIEPYNGLIPSTGIHMNAKMTVADSHWMHGRTGTSQYTNSKITDLLRLTFDKTNRHYFDSAFTVTVTFQIQHYNSLVPGHIDTSFKDTVKLTINYNPTAGTNYTDIDAKQFHGTQKFVAKIIGITSTYHHHHGIDTIPPNLYVEGKVNSERYYRFTCDSIPNSSFLTSTYVSTADELRLSWAVYPGAEKYDVVCHESPGSVCAYQ